MHMQNYYSLLASSVQLALMPMGLYLQVNSNPFRKEGSKTAAAGGGDERSAARSSSSSKPTPGNF